MFSTNLIFSVILAIFSAIIFYYGYIEPEGIFSSIIGIENKPAYYSLSILSGLLSIAIINNKS